jgi:hypothetical protein
VRCYEAPDDLDPALDSTFEFDDDFSSITAAAAGSGILPGSVILQDVTGWELLLDRADVQSAGLMRLRVTTRHESGDDLATIVAALHAGAD